MQPSILSFLNIRLASVALLLLLLIFSFSACAKRSRSRPATFQKTFALSANQSGLLNINTASSKELETLPGIGQGLAERIIEHRQRYGPFRRIEHLIMVRGISERRFRVLRDFITVE